MRYEHPSTERRGERAESLYGDSESETDGVRDERVLYGEPRHEAERDRDEQTLYGEPQHETRDDDRELPDPELLFVRMRARAAGPAVFPERSRPESPATSATER
ncbi:MULTISPECIES: hypothetical protein [Halorussus]|uniref:hypothetical protein n=1 Tax=Halorussus TaxID=1070314 RepID=UPI000E20F97A|nr:MULTISPECIES: hypothetical protein [Halorussus]NHN60675.1 hypothetical protein [Halorussus sp. JP-T4]